MNSSEHTIPNWELGTTRRFMRAIVGAAALLGIILVPGLNEGWLFLLAMIGGYQSLTAILNADLVYGLFYVVATAVPRRPNVRAEEVTTASLMSGYERQGYQPVA